MEPTDNKNIELNRVLAVTLLLGILFLPPCLIGAEQITRGGTLTVVLLAEPWEVNPYRGAWNAGFIAGQLFNALLTLDDELNPVPSLAERWEIDNVTRSYTFYLRRNVKWHDNNPFSSEDIKFTFEKMQQYDVFGSHYFANTTVDILDDYTVRITPESFLPGVQMLLFAGLDTVIFPKHILEGVDYLQSPFRTENPIGTGPFKFLEWVEGSIVLERFENYWDPGKPYLDRVLIRIIPDPDMVLATIGEGEADYIFQGMPYEAYDTLKEDENLEVYVQTRPPYKAVLDINTQHPILSNVKVRQAIAYALDRDEIVANATNGLCNVTDSYWNPLITSPNPERTIYTYNQTKAEQLLGEAGYPVNPSTGERFKIELLLRLGEPVEARTAELMKDDLAVVGITVELKTVDFGKFLELTSNYQYDTSLIKRWIMPFWTLQLFHSDWIIPGQIFGNYVQYSKDEVDTAFDAWQAETDPQKQREYLQQVELHLSQDVPEILLWDEVFTRVVRKTIKVVPEVKTSPDGLYVFWNPLENMYWTGEPVPEIFLEATIWLWVGTILVMTTTTLILSKKRKSANPRA